MSKFLSKKIAVLAALVAVVVAASAYAYLTSTGSGNGTGTVNAQTTNNIALTSSTLSFESIGQTKTVDITAANPAANSSELRVGSVTVGVDEGTATGKTCPDGSFVLAEPVSQAADKNVAPGASKVVATAKIRFVNNPDAPQNDCIATGVKLTLGS